MTKKTFVAHVIACNLLDFLKILFYFYFSVVKKAFHTARMLLDVCSIFGEPSEDQANKLTDFYLSFDCLSCNF